MIELRNIRKSYEMGANRLEVLKGIDLRIGAGELVSIMGPSGSGKSTLLNILGILDDFDQGDYSLAGTRIDHNLSQTRAAQYRNQFLGFVFQSFNLLGFKSALENVALPLYYQKMGRRERNRLALEYLDRMGLADRADHLPSELSGGQKQRVAIARAPHQPAQADTGRRTHRRPRHPDDPGGDGHLQASAPRGHDGHHRHPRARHCRPNPARDSGARWADCERVSS